MIGMHGQASVLPKVRSGRIIGITIDIMSEYCTSFDRSCQSIREAKLFASVFEMTIGRTIMAQR